VSTPTIPARSASLLGRVADPGRLAAAWADVLASDRDDGVLGAGVARFAQDADEYLARIAADLESGSYEPGQLTPVAIPRPDGQMRMLHIPAVRDRVVERSVLAVLTPAIDPLLGPFSYAYRPGMGVTDAAQAVAALRDEGLGWLARSDFHDCFGSVPVSLLRRVLSVLIEDPGLLALVEALLNRRAAAHGGAAVVKGRPQGSPLSPLWANLILAGFDTQVARAGFPLVRYADDGDHDERASSVQAACQHKRPPGGVLSSHEGLWREALANAPHPCWSQPRKHG
jgi:retron-type reverse transcriptase